MPRSTTLSSDCMLTTFLQQLLHKENLSTQNCEDALQIMLDGAPTEQTAAFLALLHAKTETASELLGMVKVLQQHMVTISYSEDLLDIVGTGGDQSNSVNISTAAALLVASLGVPVAKHGNRAVSSRCGSA